MARIRQQYPQNYGSSGNISTEFENLIRYLNSAELGNKTIGELMRNLFDEDGVFDGPVEMRRDLSGDIQYRIGDYTDDSEGWKTLVEASELRGESGQIVSEIGAPIIHSRVDVNPEAAQTVINYAHEEADELLVFVDGVLQREGAGHDYEHDYSANTVTFTSGFAGTELVTIYKIRATLITGFTRVDYDTTVDQSVFAFEFEESTSLQVYLNGILQREGGANDFVADPTNSIITFTSAVPTGNTVTIITVENTSAQVVTGLMMEANYVDLATGLILLEKVQIADDAIPTAKVNGLASTLAETPKLTVSSSEPVGPATGDFWLNTATAPNQLLYYDGVQFLQTSPESQLPSFSSSNANQVLHVNGTGTGLTYKSVDLSTVIPKTEKGSANGVASLDSDGRLPTAQLPSVLVTDSVYMKEASPSAGTYTLHRIFKQSVQIVGISVQTGGGTCDVQIALNGVGTGPNYAASTTPNELTIGTPVSADASSTAITLDVIVSSVSTLTDLEVTLAMNVLSN